MTGGTAAHDRITFNLQKALDARLTGKPCQPWGSNMKIVVDGRARYPDAFVVCQPVPPAATIADNPVLVFEVVSEGSNIIDLIDKNREYRATPSIQRYVILQQTRAAAVVFARRGQDWLSETVAGPDAYPYCNCPKPVSTCRWPRLHHLIEVIMQPWTVAARQAVTWPGTLTPPWGATYAGRERRCRP